MATQTGSLLNSLSDPAQSAAVQTENETILDLHAIMEAEAHDLNVNGTTHGLTNTGETVGLGKIGDDNIITDAAQAAGDVLNGATPSAEANSLFIDAGDSATAVGTMMYGASYDTANPDLAQDVANGAAGSLGDGSPLTGLGGGSDPLVSADGGNSDGSPIINAAVLSEPNNDAPIGLAAGNGQNIVDASVLPNENALGNLNGGNGSGDHLISGDAGESNGSQIANAGVLTDTDSGSPLGFDVGNGQNIADATVLPNDAALGNLNGNGSGDHLVSGDAGASDGSPGTTAGVLTQSDSQAPLGVDVANGQNVADASVLSNSDALSFPDLGGAGTDSLTGIVPAAVDTGNIDTGNVVSSGASGTGDSLVDVGTDDGSDAVALHTDDHSSTLGLNDQPII